MVNLDRLNQLLTVDIRARTASVQAGMTLHELHRVLAENGLALSNLGSISDQTIAGVMATATHGTGASFKSLSAMVRKSFSLFLIITLIVNLIRLIIN